MNAIQQVWQRIETVWQSSAPPDSLLLAPGATESEIEQLEGLLEIALLDDVRASYRLHNGGFTMELVSEIKILPLKEIAEWWRILNDLLDDEEWARQTPDSDWLAEAVEPVWWSRRWIPLGQDCAGNLTCLDLAPAPGGTTGQIIDWDHECGPTRVLFPGFLQLLEAFADQVQRGPSEQGE